MLTSSPWTEVSPLGDLLVKSANRHPNRDALVFPESRVTYSQLLDGAMRVARGLLAQGVKRGEHVGLLASNSSDFVQAFFGISLMGAVVVPLNVRHKATELAYIIRNADLVAVLTEEDDNAHVNFADLLCDALPGLADTPAGVDVTLSQAPMLRRAVLLRGASSPGYMDSRTFASAAESVADSHVQALRKHVRLRDTAIIIYTSGTTANPKGCMLSHEALSRGPVERAQFRLACGNNDVHWGAGPLFHIGSLGPAIGAWGAGITYTTDLYYDAPRALALIKDGKATTIWPWFPAIVLGLMDQPGFDGESLPHVKRIVLIASGALVEKVQARFPDAEILQGCGMTETAGIFGLSRPDDSPKARAHTQGKVYPGLEVRLVDPHSGEESRAGDIGEIWVRGYCVMDGYYKDPEKTAASLDAEGWLHTGDLYVGTEDGDLVFSGRLKDMLKVGGENVAVVEVESYLSQHPAVRIAEVVGKPDPRLDEVPVAFVELHEGADLTEEALIAFCKGRIANYKVPREVHFVAPGAWPMSLTKIDKRGLRQRLAESADTHKA
ncbi:MULTISPECIES: class I adenylate-forming enzyme family protein [Polaromonas]|uniref:Class I adenylate-forming enzyme family protein n=1 Tax=Polaromonas aquatica TaxID=332657 RepID=A0ABW1U4L1_9BURK